MAPAQSRASAGGTVPPAGAGVTAATVVGVWDPVVRLFHWLLVAAFAVAWLTGDELERLHEAAGYVIAGLLAVRVVWGFVGGRHARFADFVRSPPVVLAYLADIARLRARRHLGHNPAGGAMVVALILMLAVTAATGIMMTTDTWWGVEWVEEAHELAATLTLVLVGLHVAGVILASFTHRENLVGAMITGRKRRP